MLPNYSLLQTLCLKTQGHPERYKAASRALKAISKVRQLLLTGDPEWGGSVVLRGKGTRSREGREAP